MEDSREWLEVVPAAHRLEISVRELYAAVEGRIDARWVCDPLRRIEVAVDEGSAGRLSAATG